MDGAVGVDPSVLLLRRRVPVRCSLLSLYLRLGDDVGLVYGSLNDLLLFRVEILCEVLVEGGLFLLETCS